MVDAPDSQAFRADDSEPRAVVLAARNLTWRVGGFVILDDVTVEVHAGEFLSVIGPNGAGKSTLVNLLSGAARPTSGSIELGGHDISKARPYRRSRGGIGRTYQTSSLFSGLSVVDNMRIAALGGRGALDVWRRPSSNKAREARVSEVLASVGLHGRRDDIAKNLPHGDKRRLEIALAVCCEPTILLLDEPTAGVSAEQVDALVDVVRSVHKSGQAVVMVEHHMDLVMSLSDRIAVLHQGRLLLADTPHAVMGNEIVRGAYLGEQV